MTRLENPKLEILYKETGELEKRASFLKNRAMLLEATVLAAQTEDKYLKFMKYLKQTKKELESVTAEWVAKMIELDKLMGDDL